MKIYKKNRPVSKIILLFTATTLLLSSTHIAEAALGDTFRSFKETLQVKLPDLMRRTRAQVANQLAAIYQRVGFDREKNIDRLLKNIVSLGKQVGEVKTCMVNGKKCSVTQQRAFYTTAVSVLALTALAVGFTVVAATSKEADEELDLAMKQTSQEVQGWSPINIFKRLKNKLTAFRMSLLGMKKTS